MSARISKLPFELLLALRYLRPKRTFVSVITLISIIGVMLGVAVLIIVLSVMTGFDRQLRDRILGFKAHMRVYADAPFSNYRKLIDTVKADPHVKGVAPYVEVQVLVKTQPDNGRARVIAPLIRGVDADAERSVSILPQSVVPGMGKFDLHGNGVLLGSDLALQLDVRVGDRILIYSIHDLEAMEKSYREHREEGVLPGEFEVRGIFDVGYYEYNAMVLVISLANAQDLYDLGDAVQGLWVKLDDPEQSQAVRSELGPKLPPGFEISIWQQENSGLLDAVLVEKNVMFYLLFFIMIVAAFGITSALITFVVQKTREIGMLKALGATGGQVMWLFLSQSLLVGVIGVLTGLGLGLLAVHYRNEFLAFMRWATGFELFPARIYSFSELPAYIDRSDLLVICGGSLLICLLAGLIPAWNAGRLQPVEALRHD